MPEENTDTSTENNSNDHGIVLTDDLKNPPKPDESSTEGDAADPKSDESSTEGEQGNADEGGAEGAPEAYADFTMPEGMEVDKQLLEQAVPIFKELNLSQEQAQKLVDLKAQEIQASQQASVDSFNQLKQDWLTEAQSDKEIGGDKFDEHVSDAKLFITKFGTPELKTLLNEYGVGNHPEVIRAFARAGKLLKEDVPGNTGAPASGKKDRADTMYPSARKE